MWQEAKPPPVNVVMRVVDMVSKHVVVAIDTVGNATIQAMPHLDLLRKINHNMVVGLLKRKGRCSMVQVKQACMPHAEYGYRHQAEYILEGVAPVVQGAYDVVRANLYVWDMAAQGCNCKCAINYMMGQYGVGEFQLPIILRTKESKRRCPIGGPTPYPSRAWLVWLSLQE